jgi:hypothetical protein
LYRNSSWERWGRLALILATLLFLIGLLIQILEIVRIYNGLYNYGLSNYDLTGNSAFPVANLGNAYFLYAEPWHIWPWTYAG